MLFSGILFLIGCSRVDDSKMVVFSNNLESVYGWSHDTKIERRESHSGKFAAYADSSQIYNLGFRLPIREMSSSTIYHINAKVWANCATLNNNSFLAIDILSGGKSKAYKTARIEDFTNQTGIWFGVSATLDVPLDVSPDDEVAVYVMNHGSTRVWFDDMVIEAIKYK